MNTITIILIVTILVLLYVLYAYYTDKGTELAQEANLLLTIPPITDISKPIKVLTFSFTISSLDSFSIIS